MLPNGQWMIFVATKKRQRDGRGNFTARLAAMKAETARIKVETARLKAEKEAIEFLRHTANVNRQTTDKLLFS